MQVEPVRCFAILFGVLHRDLGAILRVPDFQPVLQENGVIGTLAAAWVEVSYGLAERSRILTLRKKTSRND